MKRRVARPQSTPLSLFFFTHLATGANGAEVGDAAQDGSGLLASLPGTQPQHHVAALTSGADARAEVDRALWERFTPASYKERAASLLSAERAASSALEDELAAAWGRVEALLARNKVRRATLDSAALADAVAPVSSMLFWTTEEVAERFGLETDVGEEGAPGPSTARIKLNYSVLAAPPLVDDSVASPTGEAPQSCRDGAETQGNEGDEAGRGEDGGTLTSLGTHHIRAYTIAREDLLDPSKRPHCLRRLFAPTLRRKDELPRHTTLLLREVQQVQSEKLPKLESLLEEMSIMFSVPLHVPFRAIANVLTRNVCQPTGIEALEQDAVEQLALGEQLAAELDAYVTAHTDNPDKLAMLSQEEKLALAEHMWQLLFAELDEHKALHAAGLRSYEAVTRVGEDGYHELVSSVDACDTASRGDMVQLMHDAECCSDAVRRSQARTTGLVDEMDRAFERNAAELRAAVDAKTRMLAKSEASQEKLARRVREAVKELYSEQVRYEEAAAELLRDRLSLAQLETSYEQLRRSFSARREQARRVEQHTANLQELLRLAEEARRELLGACRQHVERVHHDDYYRRCRVMSKVLGNTRGWSRCLQDVGALYEERFSALEGRSKASWQLNYLVAGERDWAAGNLLEVRPEVSELRASWEALQPLLEPLDLAEADRTLQLGGAGAAGDERRARMVLLDGPHAVQRKVTTMAQYKARRQRVSAEESGRADTTTSSATTAAAAVHTTPADDAAVVAAGTR